MTTSRKSFYCVLFNLLSLFNLGKTEIEPFIVKGELVGSIREFPSSALLRIWCYTSRAVVINICGASVLNQYILLTAGHCFYGCDPKPSYAKVIVGTKNRNHMEGLLASRYIVHEDYVHEFVTSDIALVLMDKPLVFSDKVKRVALATNLDKYIKSTAMLTGWGVTDEKTRAKAVNLKKTKQKLWTRQKCSQKIKGPFPAKVFCGISGYTADDEVSMGYGSHGDSGSGLLVNNYILVGIVSFKRPEIAVDVVIYTDVTKYLDWIKRKSYQIYCRDKV